MIAHAILALGSVGFFVVLAEAIGRFYPRLSRELTRKIAHIGIAVMVSVWPLYLDQPIIISLGVVLTLGVMVAAKLGVTSSIHGVTRRNYGDITFGLAVIVTALIAPTAAIFSAALLILGIADGLAAVIGTVWGKATRYRVFGDGKSIVGTLTFFVVTVCVLYGYHFLAAPLTTVAVLSIAGVITFLENIGLRGTDNLLITVSVVVLLGVAL